MFKGFGVLGLGCLRVWSFKLRFLRVRAFKGQGVLGLG